MSESGNLTRWQASSNVLSSKIDDEIVLLSVENGHYFSLDSVGSRIWEIISLTPSTIDVLVNQLMDEYQIDEETCKNDVQSFIDEMSSKGLILPETK